MSTKMTKAIVVSMLTAVAMFLSSTTIAEPRSEKKSVVSLQHEALLLVGPASTAKGQTLRMMGQIVFLESSDAKRTVRHLKSGAYTAVFGYLSETGQLSATRIQVLESQYIPGSSPVMVSGMLIVSLDKNGHIQLGDLNIDVTPSLSVPIQFDSHEITVFFGTQPNPDGIVSAHIVKGFTSYTIFSENQNIHSEAFLASIDGRGFSINGGGFSIDGGGFSIDGGGTPYSIDGGGFSIDGGGFSIDGGGFSIDGGGTPYSIDGGGFSIDGGGFSIDGGGFSIDGSGTPYNIDGGGFSIDGGGFSIDGGGTPYSIDGSGFSIDGGGFSIDGGGFSIDGGGFSIDGGGF